MAKKKTEHYVDNKKLYQAMVEYKDAIKEADESGDPRPPVTSYIGDCIMKIATHLSHKPNFINYPFKEEMICDGIENCLQYIDNFKPEKSQNPFSYFTQIIFYAFLRRIQKEKKHLYTKYKLAENLNIMNMTSDIQEHDRGEFASNKANEWGTDQVTDFIRDFEESKRKKKK